MDLITRNYWVNKIEAAWKKRSVIWLAGVRRVGKTCLCQSLEKAEYFDCELPRVRHLLEDPEAFLRDMNHKRIILDEIHRLDNPTELLRISADHYPKIKFDCYRIFSPGCIKKISRHTNRKKIHNPVNSHAIP